MEKQAGKGVLSRLFNEFLESEQTGGLLLLACTVVSMVLANSDWADSYIHFWHINLQFPIAGLDLDHSIEHWINDGLMAIFFLLVGLEIERELYIGELSSLRKAILPVIAAMGGMLIPALIHFSLNSGTIYQNGFGIPMATDIAFALGMLSLLGKRVPVALKVFLTALAIIDDLGAILVIAFFYNNGISLVYLSAALGIFVLLLLFNRLRIRRLVFYLVPGIIMWYCMLQSGVHATITGVLLAFAIPFTKNDDATNPSYRLQHALHKPVAFLILPVFALANTAVQLLPGWTEQLRSSNSLGIITGLFLGKLTGIVVFSWAFVKMKITILPSGVSWKHIAGVGCLAGIGFTMAIFIANLAFNDPAIIQDSKIAIFAGSLISCVVGLVLLASVRKRI